MIKSTITRERIQRIIRAINSEAYDEEEIREWLSSDEIMELSRMALAAMDSESECLPLYYLQGHKDGLEWAAQLAEANHPETGDWLYDDPIELAKAIRKGPDMPPAQPAPVVPEEVTAEDCPALVKYDVTEVDEAWARGFNSCRAAMLQAYPVCTCPSGDGSLRRPCPVHPGNSPTQSDCCPAQNSVTPAQNQGWIPVSERMPEDRTQVILWDAEIGEVTSGHYSHKTQTFYHCGDAIENEITHWMPPPCAPQEVKGE